MAKGQKRSNRETRKPKQDKPRPAAAVRPGAGAIDPRVWVAPQAGKRSGR